MKIARIFYLSLILVVLLSVNEGRGQDDDLRCGDVGYDKLTIPSYKFLVIGKDGQNVKNLQVVSQLIITETRWMVNGWLDMDPYWKIVYHNQSVPVRYDPKPDIYVTEEIAKINVVRRREGPFYRRRDCWDRVVRFEVKFHNENGDKADFIFHFPDHKASLALLPDEKSIKELILFDKDGRKISKSKTTLH